MAADVDETRAVAFKGRMFTLTVLAVNHADPDVVAAALDDRIARSPAFFRNMPVLLKLPRHKPDLSQLVALLRERDLVPVALLNASDSGDELAAAAHRAGLGVLDDTSGARERPQRQAQSAATRVVDRPVRSGQQIYARDADLVVTAAVSEGAEVLADGHIHVYGPLRGRALAGASGDADARIFCRRLEADLVAVAGCYKVADDIDEAVRGQPVQVRLDGDSLVIETQE